MVISQSNNSFTPAKKLQPLRVSLVIIVSHSGLQWNLKVRQDDIRFLKVYIKLRNFWLLLYCYHSIEGIWQTEYVIFKKSKRPIV